MDGQRNFNRIDRNRGSGIYRCSDYGKKEIRKPGFSGKFESNFFLVTRKTSGLNTWSWGLLFELIDLFTFTAFFLLYHTGECFLSFGEASSFENAVNIFKTFQKLFDRGLHFLYTIC